MGTPPVPTSQTMLNGGLVATPTRLVSMKNRTWATEPSGSVASALILRTVDRLNVSLHQVPGYGHVTDTCGGQFVPTGWAMAKLGRLATSMRIIQATARTLKICIARVVMFGTV